MVSHTLDKSNYATLQYRNNYATARFSACRRGIHLSFRQYFPTDESEIQVRSPPKNNTTTTSTTITGMTIQDFVHVASLTILLSPAVPSPARPSRCDDTNINIKFSFAKKRNAYMKNIVVAIREDNNGLECFSALARRRPSRGRLFVEKPHCRRMPYGVFVVDWWTRNFLLGNVFHVFPLA